MNNTVGAWYAAQIEHTSWGFPKEIPKFESTLNPEPNKNSHWYMLLWYNSPILIYNNYLWAIKEFGKKMNV